MGQQKYVSGMALSCFLAVSYGIAWAQDYPIKPVRVIAGSVGSNVDITARLITQQLAQNLGRQFIIDNRANAALSGGLLAKAPADGYTLMANASNIWILPLLQNVSYDPLKDFLAISLTSQSPNVLLVHPSLPVRSVRDLVNLAKAKPGQLNYASGGSGATPHLAAELFKSMAGVNIVRIPYKGGGAAVTAVVAGEVFLTFATAGAAMPHLRSERLRAVAVTSAEPSALFPGLPTVASAGLPGYESGSTNAFFAPAGTPAAIIKMLNSELTKVLQSADIKEKFMNAGVEAVSSSPEQMTEVMRSQISDMGKLIKEAGIRAN